MNGPAKQTLTVERNVKLRSLTIADNNIRSHLEQLFIPKTRYSHHSYFTVTDYDFCKRQSSRESTNSVFARGINPRPFLEPWE